jgi:DNA-binding NarL/FixJ family response regulator
VNKRKHRILIVDDHPVIRLGVSQLIAQQPDLEVCGEAPSLSEALGVYESTKPDLVLIDLSLKEGHGLDLVKALQAMDPAPKMLVMSVFDEAVYAERVLRAGAQGYVSKSEDIEQVITAIRRVLKDEIHLSPRMTARLLRGFSGKPIAGANSPDAILSDRELQVFELLGCGLRSREISERLLLSIKTVDTYREHIKEKLGLKDGAELVLHAILWAQRQL